MRFIASQFETYLTNNLWKRNAVHANNMAKILEKEINSIPKLQVSQEVKANGVFVYMPAEIIEKVQKKYFFHIWNETPKGKIGFKEVRLMGSWDTTQEDINGFILAVKKEISS